LAALVAPDVAGGAAPPGGVSASDAADMRSRTAVRATSFMFHLVEGANRIDYSPASVEKPGGLTCKQNLAYHSGKRILAY
jgi:hypothetical protein